MAVKLDMPVCPECGKPAELKRRKVVTGNNADDDWMWICKNYPECDMYVGCHPGGFKPLGTLAGSRLRALRWRAHKAIDTSWQSGKMTRTEVYEELAEVIGADKGKAHIGSMNEQECEKAIKAFDGRKPWKTPKII